MDGLAKRSGGGEERERRKRRLWAA
jgi:hypothetical protein